MSAKRDPLDAKAVLFPPPQEEMTDTVAPSEPRLESEQPVEETGYLETSTPLEAPRMHYKTIPSRSRATEPRASSQPQPLQRVQSVSPPIPEVPPPVELPPVELPPVEPPPVFPPIPEVPPPVEPPPVFPPIPEVPPPVEPPSVEPPSVESSPEMTIPLLDERIRVEMRSRKVGEVVVRKEIEHQIIEVPVRREKLIVEQVSPEHQTLAVVELGETQIIDANEIDANKTATQQALPLSNLSANFGSAGDAIQFLAEVASEPHSGVRNVQVKLALDNAARQANFQQWLDQYFESAGDAIQFLAEIASEPNAGVRNVQVNLALNNTAHQANLHQGLAQYSTDVNG